MALWYYYHHCRVRSSDAGVFVAAAAVAALAAVGSSSANCVSVAVVDAPLRFLSCTLLLCLCELLSLSSTRHLARSWTQDCNIVHTNDDGNVQGTPLIHLVNGNTIFMCRTTLLPFGKSPVLTSELFCPFEVLYLGLCF